MDYNVEKQFFFGRIKQSRVLVVNGSVDIKWKLGDTWIDDQENPYTTGKHTLSTAATCAKLIPHQESAYYIDETEA